MIDSRFPNSEYHEYEIHSPFDLKYNCIAWAVDDDQNWWEPLNEPGNYWPPNTRFDYSPECLIEAYQEIGYIICDNGDFEEGYKKIALYKKDNFEYSHAAKQLNKFLWSSKLGPQFDIIHTLFCLKDGYYGNIFCFMKKSINN